MAIKTEWRDPNGLTGISCLSSDTKPDAPAGSICWETDTGNRFERDGDTWQPNGRGGGSIVIPDMSAQVKQGNVYSSFYEVDAGGAGTFAKMLVFNPASSGIYVAITRIIIRANAAITFEWGYHATAFSTAPNPNGTLNRLSSGSAGSATTSYEASATNLLSTSGGGEIRTSATGEGSMTYDFMYPVLVDENNGFLLQDTVTNTAVKATLEWVEIAK